MFVRVEKRIKGKGEATMSDHITDQARVKELEEEVRRLRDQYTDTVDALRARIKELEQLAGDRESLAVDLDDAEGKLGQIQSLIEGWKDE